MEDKFIIPLKICKIYKEVYETPFLTVYLISFFIYEAILYFTLPVCPSFRPQRTI